MLFENLICVFSFISVLVASCFQMLYFTCLLFVLSIPFHTVSKNCFAPVGLQLSAVVVHHVLGKEAKQSVLCCWARLSRHQSVHQLRRCCFAYEGFQLTGTTEEELQETDQEAHATMEAA